MDKAVIEGAPAVETGAEASFEQTTEDLSLRDYFAAQALGAVLDLMEDDAEEAEDFGSFAFSAAARAYALADAMLIARDLEFEEVEEEEDEEEEDSEAELEEEEEEEGKKSLELKDKDAEC